ncbi:MAG: hypothetical protein ABI675_19380 [Chitinophagaceae bacterium]
MQKPLSKYTIKVPTKIYLRKYVTAKYGHPLPLNYNSTLGTLIICLLDKSPFSINMNKEKKDVRLSYMNDVIECTAAATQMRYKNYSLDDDKIIAINRFIENEFVDELYGWCVDKIEKRLWRPGIDKAINSFADNYGIVVDIDITFDALKKAEYRHRKRKEKIFQTVVHLPNRPSSMLVWC